MMHDIQHTLALEPFHFGALKAFEAVLELHPLSTPTRAQVERLRL